MQLRFYVGEVEVGAARMACVPRVGEEISLVFMFDSLPDDIPFVPTAHFHVDHIIYSCLNETPKEAWIQPFSQESTDVFLHVTPMDEATQAYVQRVIGVISPLSFHKEEGAEEYPRETIAINPIKGIASNYKNKLEARWAVFFETLGVPYTYQEGIFTLPQHETQILIFYAQGKPQNSIVQGAWKRAQSSGGTVYIFVGAFQAVSAHKKIKAYGYLAGSEDDKEVMYTSEAGQWAECQVCRDIRIIKGPKRRECIDKCRHGHTLFSVDSPRLLAAYTAARQYTFHDKQENAAL